MLVGATLVGYLADRYGRRPLLLTCILFFSVFTALCTFAPNAEVFGLLRLCSGFGFGGALPTAISVTMEYVRVDRRQSYGGMIIAGSPIGGALVAVIALFVVPWLGWRAMFLIASVVGLMVLVVAWRNIPESLAYLVRRGQLDKARRLARSFPIDDSAESLRALSEPADGDAGRKASPRILLVPKYRMAMILFPLVAAGAVLLTYGLNTWIPTILASAGYEMSTGLISLIGFDIGNAVGMVALSRWADRLGARRVIAGGFLVAAVGVGAAMLHPAPAVVPALLVLVGFCAGVVGPAFVFPGVYFPAEVRGTALGLTVGLSRLGGIIAPVMAGLIVGSIFRRPDPADRPHRPRPSTGADVRHRCHRDDRRRPHRRRARRATRTGAGPAMTRSWRVGLPEIVTTVSIFATYGAALAAARRRWCPWGTTV